MLADGVATQRAELRQHPVHHETPDEHAGIAAVQALRRDACILDRLERDLHQQALLRIQIGGLARGHAEIFRVEGIQRLIQKSAMAHEDLARRFGARVIELVDVQPVGGDLADAVTAFGHQRPVIVKRGDAAGKAAGHPDDGKGFGRRGAGGEIFGWYMASLLRRAVIGLRSAWCLS